MNILVAGGAGYIGSHCVKLLLAAGHRAVVLDNFSCGHRQAVPGEAVLVEGDLGDAALLRRVLREERIETVMHFAAFTTVADSVSAPLRYYRNNVINALVLLEAMVETGVKKFVFSSSCATYGLPQRVPITEEEQQRPVNPYGQTKLDIERALAAVARAHPFGYAALRYFNAAGADPGGELGEDHDPETHLIPLVLQTALGRRAQVTVLGTDYPTPDGTCLRDYIHVADLCRAHLLAIDHLAPGAELLLNLGTGRGASVREVLEAARRVTGRPIAAADGPRRPGDPPALYAAADKARQVLGWRPEFTELEAIIASAWNWHRRHPGGYAGK